MYMSHNSQPSEGRKVTTGANTPSAAPKKKITLDAYKKKLNGQMPDGKPGKSDEQMARKPAAKAPVKGPIERIKIDEEVLASLVGEEGDDAAVEPVKEKKELKRKREEDDAVKDEGEAQKKQKKEGSPKKERSAVEKDVMAPETDKAEKAEPTAQPKSSTPAVKAVVKEPSRPSKAVVESEDVQLPPKLSPPHVSVDETSLPPKLSPLSQALPPRLSPNIPDNIAQTLKARNHYRTASRSSDVSANGRNLTPPRDGKTSLLKKSPRNGFRANSSSPAIRSDVEEGGRPLSSVPTNLKALDSGTESADEIAVAKTKKQVTSNGPTRLMVRLKFKKAARETVRRILKMKPAPQKTPISKEPTPEVRRPPSVSDARHREQREGTKGVAQKVRPVHRTNGEVKKVAETKVPEKEHKRARSDDSEVDERPAKRTKAPVEPSEAKKDRPPSTPDKQGTSSPSATQKATTTPGNMRKDLLSVSMKREQSQDSNVNTPFGISQASPPDTTAPANGAAKPPTSQQPVSKTPKQIALETEQKRLEILGRELKHAAAAHLTPSPGSSPTRTDQRLAAVKSLESLLAYMTAFSCADDASEAASPRVPPSSRRTWRSMQGFYGFVKRNCEAFPLLLGIACSLGVVFNARILELATLSSRETMTREELLETTAFMFRAARDAEGKLDALKVRSAFPKTWEGKGKEGYELPISMTTAPRAAAKAGVAMLREWAAGEKLRYDLKVEVGKGPGK